MGISDVLYKFKFFAPLPVIILSGSKEAGRSKFYAGISRAAYRTDAVIIDSGVENGIEPFALRRSTFLRYFMFNIILLHSGVPLTTIIGNSFLIAWFLKVEFLI